MEADQEFADAVRDAGRQANTADLARDLVQTAQAVGQVTAELHEERLWRRRALRWFFAYVTFSAFVLAFVLVAFIYLTSIARTNRQNGENVRCTQDFIVDLVNPASPLRDKLRANEPIVNPCG